MSHRKWRRIVSRQLTILELLPPEPERPPSPPPSIAALVLRQAAAFDPWDGAKPPPRLPKKKYFASDPGGPDADHAAAVVRGCLIKRLDAAFESGELGSVLWQPREDEEGNEEPPPEPVMRFVRAVVGLARANDLAGVLKAFEAYGQRVYGDTVGAMFPEEFGVSESEKAAQEERRAEIDQQKAEEAARKAEEAKRKRKEKLLKEGGVVPFGGVERAGDARVEALAALLGSARGA